MAMQGAAQRRRRGAGAGARTTRCGPRRSASPAARRGTTVCDEGAGWLPDLADIERKITERTRAIVIINPNNPTGALYPTDLLRELVEIARRHQLIVFADEIYDKMLYDGATHTSIAALADDVLFVTFNGLSKNYRACGYRSGWMVISGDKRHAQDYIEGLNILASMRLCANVPGQFAIQTALGGYQSIDDLVAPGGRLARQRDLAYDLVTSIPGVTCVKPKAALYLFPRLDPARYPDRGRPAVRARPAASRRRCCVVQGTGFNWPSPDHFRVVFLPNSDDLDRRVRPHRPLPRRLLPPPRRLQHEAHQRRTARHRHRRRRHLDRAHAQRGGDHAPRRARRSASPGSPRRRWSAPAS